MNETLRSTYNMSFHIERIPKVPGTQLDATSFGLLISGAAAPFLALVIIHSVLRFRRRRIKARYQGTVFTSESNSCNDAWNNTWKGGRMDGDVTSVWLTANHVHKMEGSPHTVRGYLPQTDLPSPWGTKFDLEDTINAFFDANSIVDVSCHDNEDLKTVANQNDSKIYNNNNNLMMSEAGGPSHETFESLCDVIINNMAEPPDQYQDSNGQQQHQFIDHLKASKRLPVSEEMSMATESSMGEFSVEEEETLRDFDAILSSYCDEESDWTDDWQYMKIKY